MKTKIELWVAKTTGLLDLRETRGPFQSLNDAISCQKTMPSKRGTGKDGQTQAIAFIGAWYALHPKGTMVDGPYLTRAAAEFERKNNVRDPQAFECDCNRDVGFVAEVVKLVGGTAIMERRA